MKRFTVPCNFNETKHPFHVYIGKPNKKHHPLKYQSAWLAGERGGIIPQDVMDSFKKLQTISEENNVSFEGLCVYALSNKDEDKIGEEDK